MLFANIFFIVIRPLNNRRTTSTSAPVVGKSRPRICQRLIINCASKPEHRCCQYEIEAAKPEITSGPVIEVSTTTLPSIVKEPPRKIPIVSNSVKSNPKPVVVKGTSKLLKLAHCLKIAKNVAFEFLNYN